MTLLQNYMDSPSMGTKTCLFQCKQSSEVIHHRDLKKKSKQTKGFSHSKIVQEVLCLGAKNSEGK